MEPSSGCGARGPRSPADAARGDILYRLEIEVPRDLTREQKAALGDFANAMNDHDPRERLLRDASGGVGAKVGRAQSAPTCKVGGS